MGPTIFFVVPSQGPGLASRTGQPGTYINRLLSDALISRVCYFLRSIEFLLKVDVVKISCGNHHLVALTNEGQLYAWGRGNYGQLGLGNLQDWQVDPPLPLPVLGNVVVVKFNKYNPVTRIFVHVLYSCFPILVNWHLDENISSIQCGPDCTAIVTEHQNVYACGLNKCNKLGLNRPSLFKLKVMTSIDVYCE